MHKNLCNGNVLGRIDEVNRRRARIVGYLDE